MKADESIAYRLALAAGFLAEAEQDLNLQRWRSCVDNAQLVVENAGKAVLTLFGVTPKTHDPAQQLAAILRTQPNLPADIQTSLQQLLPDLLALGIREHFLTDYGDETSYTLPWDLFTQDSADEAITAARRSLYLAQNTIDSIRAWQNSQTTSNQE